jgi:hypothetical protein
MTRVRRLIGLHTEQLQIVVRSVAMWSVVRHLGFLAAGVAVMILAPETADARRLPSIAPYSQTVIVEARASRSYGHRRRRGRRSSTREVVPPQETRAGEIPLPKRNPHRERAEQAEARADKLAKPDKTGKEPQPSAAAEPVPSPPPPPVTWSADDVIEGREQCLVALSQIVVEIEPAPPMRSGQCGSASPVMLRSVGKGAARVTVHPPAMLNCAMVSAVHDWLEKTVQPAAREILGEDIVQLESVAGYQCRNRARTTRLSEHAIANAVDILGFTTRSGLKISVLDVWGPTHRDTPQPAAAASAPDEPPLPLPHPKRGVKLKPMTARAILQPNRPAAPTGPAIIEEQFLKRVHDRSCDVFKTVLGPEANEDHRNHFHLDLAQRKRGAHYCR